jgi:hypothetical protein
MISTLQKLQWMLNFSTKSYVSMFNIFGHRLWDWFDELEENDATNIVHVERENSVYAWVFLFWFYR